MQNSELDAVAGELFPALRGGREGDRFLFDPARLDGKGSVRHYYPEYLDWLRLRGELLPVHRFHIHAARPCPANLELRGWSVAEAGSPGRVSLFVDIELYRSTDVLRMALAHELTHLHLMVNDLQTVPGRESTGGTLSRAEEIRTDVASIVLGLGKLVLNGVSEYAALERDRGFQAQLGYLPVAAYAHVYRKVNELAGVPERIALDGLNATAREAVS